MAIVFDTTSTGNGTGTSLTISHTMGAVYNGILIVPVLCNTDKVTGVTFNGVAMTLIDKIVNASNAVSYLFYILSPASGAHNIVVSLSSSVFSSAVGISFAGVAQTSPEATYKATSPGLQNSMANTLTTVADNAVHVAGWAQDAFAITSITGATFVSEIGGYSAVITPAGSNTLTANSAGGNNNWATVGASFAPATPSSGFLALF